MSEAKSGENAKDRLQGIKYAVSGFFGEVAAEFHRINWPKGRELVESSAVVLVFIVILSAVVFVFDKIFENILKILIGA